MSKKIRLDVLVTERGLCESRQKAQTTIMAGLVFVDGQRSDKPGTPVAEDAHVEVRGHALRYVSRGGLKLEKAMQTFPITLEGKVCADIGASTGGFTDCMLQNGAAKVYAVDVGYGQLDWKLRSDARVVCLERTNARYLSAEQIPEALDFASIDVSFISLKLIFPALYALLREGGEEISAPVGSLVLYRPRESQHYRHVAAERTQHRRRRGQPVGFFQPQPACVENLCLPLRRGRQCAQRRDTRTPAAPSDAP